MEWLARPLVCDGTVVAASLNPARLTDDDLRTICMRMHTIFHTIEMPRAEERWMPVEIFDAIDTLEGMVLYGQRSPSGHTRLPRLAEWEGVICEFGAHYQLAGSGPIAVDQDIYRKEVARYHPKSVAVTNEV